MLQSNKITALYSVFGKYNLYEFARFQIVSAKTGKVFLCQDVYKRQGL